MLASFGDEHWKATAKTMIRGWMVSAIDALSLVFGTLTDQKQHQSRASLIVYGTVPPQDGAALHEGAAAGDASAEIIGKHWIYYEGQLQPFSMTEFDQSSIGYQVLSRQKQSPYETNTRHMDVGQKRSDDHDRPFVTFRVNDRSVLTVDWPGTIQSGGASTSDAKNSNGSAKTK